ncbi:hypothetical protein, partial [Escherichia coli]
DALSTSTHQKGKTEATSGEIGIRGRIETGPVTHQLVLSGNRLESRTWQGQTRYADYATNIYHKGPTGWRMVMHHASSAPTEAGVLDLHDVPDMLH